MVSPDVPSHRAAPSRLRRALWALAFIVGAVALYGGSLWIIWRPIFAQVAEGNSLQLWIKDWYLGDQLTYLSIARNVQEGAGAYVEPFTETGRSIYPSGYYWVLGLFGRVTGTNPFFAWNVVGMLCTIGAAVAAGGFARWVTGKTSAWLLGPFSIVLGTLVYFSNEGWRAFFGPQAVLWPQFAIFFNPGAEAPGLALCVLALLCTLRGLTPADRPSWRWLAGAGALVGLNFNVHTYTTLFTAAIIVFTLLAWHLLRAYSLRAAVTSAVSVAVFFGIVLSGVMTAALGLFALVLIGTALPLFLVPAWRKLSWRPLVAMGVFAGVFASPLALRILSDARKPDSFLSYRQQVAQDDPLSLPLYQVFIESLPVLLLAAVALVVLFRSRSDDRTRTWVAALIGVLVASTLLVFNASWGMNQEPYRFYPYALFVLCVVSLPWLLTALSRVVFVLPRLALVGLLGATLPTTAVFANDTKGLSIAYDQTSYKQIAALLPNDGVVFVDKCLPVRPFKVITGKRIQDVNTGLALPANLDAANKIRYEQERGIISDDATLRAAGITSFVTADDCITFPRADMQRRFSSPDATVGKFEIYIFP